MNINVVREDHSFAMGDNRRGSKDSRDIGAIAKAEVLGTTGIVYFPFKDIRVIEKQKY